MTKSGERSARIGGGAFALAAIAFALLVADHLPPEPAEAAEVGPKVLVKTTGDNTELRETIPITRRAGAEKRVVASMGPERLPDLERQDGVEVTAEIQVTTDCDRPSRRCAGRPYDYNPIVKSRLVLADRTQGTDGPEVESISDRQRTRCRQRQPFRTHHCVIVFRDAGFTHAQAASQGCAPGSCRVNLVLDAHNRHARGSGKDKLVIGGNRPDGTIAQNRAQINAVRFRPESQPRVSPTVTGDRKTKRLPLTRTGKVVYSQRLEDLRADEQLVVDARMRTEIDHLPYNVLVSSRLILADGEGQTTPGDVARRVASKGGDISRGNGFNCVHKEAPCPTDKVGALTIEEDAGRPLYVNLVVSNSAKRATPKGEDRAKVARGGRLEVVRYPAALRG